ncbi:uncharacterized protein METZ01_LOCUS24412, partial [marine metagenome]
VKWWKNTQNAIFVENETYKWATPKSSINRRLIYLSALFVLASLLFSVLK